jgi:iron complex transport system ATP-binding protein
MTVPLLNIADLSVQSRGRDVLHNVSLQVRAGEVIGLIGPNGAGKTTLMRAALGLVPHDGQSSLAQLSPTGRARAAAWLPQSREIAWPMQVEALVALGRTPHLAPGQRPGPEDREAVAQALAEMGLEQFAARTATRLSGGEQARVLIARALAQRSPLLMADEPIAGLDPAHQIATMDSFTRLAGDGRAVWLSLHDLGLAARHCTRLVVLHKGRIVADGAPGDVLSPELMREVFGVTAWFRLTEQGPVFQPLCVVTPQR